MKHQKYQKWDVHHHIVPDFYVDEMKKMGMQDYCTIKWPKWNPEASLKLMETFQIEKAFVSLSTPGSFFKDIAYSQSLNRRCNEYISRMVKDYPGKFGGFASVTLPDVPSAMKELEYALDTLKLDGISLMSNVNGKYLGDKDYREFFFELNKRNAIIYIHPSGIAGKEDHRFLYPLYLWQNDTTKTMIDFIRSGYHRDYPQIKWILSHGGGILSPIYNTLIQTLEKENPNIVTELEQWKSQIFLDTASKAFDEQIPELLNFSDVKHVLFGSDIGWGNKMAVSTLEKSYNLLDQTMGLTEAQINDIYLGNAQRLFSQEKVPVDTKGQPPIVIRNYRPAKQSSKIKYHYHCLPQKVIDTIQSLRPTLEIKDLTPWNEEQTLEWMRQNSYEKVMLSFDLPLTWKLNSDDIRCVLKVYNEEVAKIKDKNSQSFGAYGAIDVNSPANAVTEMKHCIGKLKLDGICISSNLFDTSFDQLIDENVLANLAALKVPVLLHPQDSTGIPLINDNYLDAVYFLAKTFYFGVFSKYFKETEFVLAHTGGVLPYLANPINILYYMSIKKPKIMGYMIDTFIRHNPKGYNILMNMIVD